MANLEHYLRISIVDSKHFSEEDLFTELATNEGCVLFECESLLKVGGVDFMDCPLQICLKIFVRRRLKDEAPMLYHMVLPLAVISKHFLQPPHEWETWVGLLPSNSSLDICAPGDMFAHAVINLLADKTSPKLRLKFRHWAKKVVISWCVLHFNQHSFLSQDQRILPKQLCWVVWQAITIQSFMPTWHYRSRAKKRDASSKTW